MFSGRSRLWLERFLQDSEVKYLPQDKLIGTYGSVLEYLYILEEGEIRIEKQIEWHRSNRWPQGPRQWEQITTTQTVNRTVAFVKSGQ